MKEAPLNDPKGAGQVPVGGGIQNKTIAETAGLSRFHLALLAFGFAPLLLAFFANLWGRPYYQFFPSALAGAWFLAWCRAQEIPRPLDPGDARVVAALMGGSFCILLAGVWLYSPWLAALAAELGLAGVAWWLGGGKLLRAMLPALVLLLTIIPPPLEEDDRLMLLLRGLAVRWSGQVLDGLGVFHYLSGNVIELPRNQLLVEEACSGINSVLFTSAVCLFYMMWRRRPVWRIMVCLPCVVAGVLLGNVIRITLGAWLSFHQIVDILSGWRHELTGLVLVAAYLILIGSLDELLDFLTLPTRERKTDLGVPAPTPSPVESVATPSRRAARWGLLTGGAFALLGVAGLGMAEYRHIRGPLVNKSALPAGATFAMPAQIGDWRLLAATGSGTNMETDGIFSKIWRYQRGGTVAEVGLDYPFRGYHDVTICYRGNGWHINREERKYGGADGGEQPLMEVEMDKEPITHGLLWFSTVDEKGHWMESPGDKFVDRWKMPVSGWTTSYRVQVLVPGYVSLPASEREPARQLFEAARKILVQQLFDQIRGQP